ncbi:peptide-methionine (R)-S-oxide reductase [Sphingobium sp. SCG-1]|uniref:peptide-methionine (R)-S-oxide reductase MsrB n=1 Tax=Sphingobium sp. SCG-1 TaxID=2072936 RepID=UPI000CD67D19|nr:peptide-methionine (R)-S-oxide reductase MsrB [Sphingobium sp. SCG-1]AUW57242.1 peptide-methionine (R)-S-oxide reductase [Sphingobium sp. SCG-1]
MPVSNTLTRRALLGTGGVAVIAIAVGMLPGENDTANAAKFPVALTPAQWKKKLNPQQYAILREASTEQPFSSPLNKEYRAGTFSCAGCDQKLFSSKTKFDSGTGWPSFWQPLPRAIATSRDNELGYSRTEVHCSRCGGHLGHVFDDGPKPTGLRYCMNGGAMKFMAEA